MIDAAMRSWIRWIRRVPERVVRALVLNAALALLVAISGAQPAPARAQQVLPATVPNNTPLFFGMSAPEVSLVLGTPLIYVRGRPGDELYLALANVKGAALSNRNDGLYLQFRRGRLEGWKGDWRSFRPCCN
jgi:hypothetical protein